MTSASTAFSVSGVGEGTAHRIERWCREAAAELGVELDFPVSVTGPLLAAWTGIATGEPAGSGSKDGLWLHRWTATGATDTYLGFVLYEEVAHLALGREGVPHEGFGDFVHEVFATWFQFDRWIASGPIDRADLVTTPVLPRGYPEDLGKHLGAALAGSDRNRQHLDHWLGTKSATPAKKRAIQETERLLELPLSAAAVAGVYKELMEDQDIAGAWSLTGRRRQPFR